MTLSFDEAVRATQGRVFDLERAPQNVRVATDTRAIERGDAFLALKGERFDGHDYTAEAVAKGASMLIVDQADARVDGVATLVVRDGLAAYMALAGASRARFSGRVLGITGSAGKTTTKAFAAQLLATKYGARVLAAPANENNEIGVSKLLLGADDALHDVLVVVMAARHFGDIAALVAIARPDVGILTNVGDAHLEVMGSPARLEETKWALFGRGARAILNARDAVSLRRASSLGHSPHWFDAVADRADVPKGRVTALVGRTHLIDADASSERCIDVDVRVPGDHNRANLAAALAAALELGADIHALAAELAGVHLPAGRFESMALAGGARAIFDAYNANAAGTMAALDAFVEEPEQRRIAILGSMAELGEEAPALHARVGAHAAATKVDVLLVSGDFAKDLADGALRAGLSSERIVHVATNNEAAAWLRAHVRAGDVVLIKGSRKYKLEEIVEQLRG